MLTLILRSSLISNWNRMPRHCPDELFYDPIARDESFVVMCFGFFIKLIISTSAK